MHLQRRFWGKIVSGGGVWGWGGGVGFGGWGCKQKNARLVKSQGKKKKGLKKKGLFGGERKEEDDSGVSVYKEAEG